MGDIQDWIDSPKAIELMDKLRNLMIEDGYDGIKYRNIAERTYDPETGFYIVPQSEEEYTSYIVFSNAPENIRSRFARFDPAKSNEAGLNKAHGGFVVKPLYDRAP